MGFVITNFNFGYTVPKVKFPISRNEVLLSSCYHPKSLEVSCKENNNHRRNPDFSRHQKGSSSSSSSSSRGRNRHYQDRRNSDSQDETDPLTSKNGSILSLSSNQRHSATSTPGRREKEIVELFRKVQAQLRERAAIKEDRKIDSSLQQGQQQQRQGDRGTVDSLLNLLRKHSVAQSKKSAKEDFNVDEPEKIESVEEEHSSTFLSTNNLNPEPDPEKVRSVRPASSFRRRSPVPRVKFQPVFLKSEESGKNDVEENEQEFVSLKEIDDIISEVAEDSINEDDHHDDIDADEDGHDDDEIKEENAGEPTKEIIDIASLKLTELKEIAKSRGLKGYSKMKKNDLIELLSAVDS